MDGQQKLIRLLPAIILILIISALPALAGPHPGAPQPKDAGPAYAPDRIIVRFASAPTISRGPKGEVATKIAPVDRLGARFGVKDMQPVFRHASSAKTPPAGLAKKIESTYIVTYSGKSDPHEVARAYARLPEVEYAEPDYIRHTLRLDPNDPYWLSNNSWGQNYRDQWDMEMMKCPDAWDIETGDASVVIAVIDTGIDYNHADIAANMWHNPGEIPGNGLDDDSNGRIDDIYGYDFAYKDSNPMDGNGHGTHVAGTIGAVGNNGTGIAGVSWACKLMAVKALDDSGNGYDSDLADAVAYAVSEGAQVINMSWGGPGFSQTIHEVLVQAHLQGVILCAAAGNSSSDLATFHPAGDNYVITVSASDPNDQACSFTNWGIKTAVSAPGGNGSGTTPACAVYNCLSLRAGATDPLSGDCGPGVGVVGGNYYRLAGTSMACPHVAGLAGLARAAHPTWTNEQVRQAIQMRADDIRTPGFDRYAGHGRINAYSTLTSPEPMTAFISSPNNGGEVSGHVSIQGTVTGPSFQQWTLDYGQGYEPTSWTTIASGFAPVVRGTLATWDVTGVTGGLYTLRLRASGSGGVQNAEFRIAITPKSTEGSGHYTELFDTAPFDLANKSVQFTPDGSARFYSMCIRPITQLPTDPVGGMTVRLADDDSFAVTLSGGAQVLLYGFARNQFYIASNGYITFDTGDTTYTESFSNHFNMKRIAALLDDLVPNDNISWKQFSDRVAVTYMNISEYGGSTANTFQIEMFFDGRIVLSYLNMAASDGLAGLSAGMGVPSGFVESDLSGYPECVEVSRALLVAKPNGGECYEPGTTIPVQWSRSGSGWTAGDTLKLVYSTDSGTTWSPVPGADSIPYDTGSFSWPTAGLVNSTHYRVRVEFNGDNAVHDDSNSDFTVGPDTIPPSIIHTPLTDTALASGPYNLYADVTDNAGVGSVTLYWSKNGGPTNVVPMLPNGGTDRYYANIPGPSVIGDRYCYHIEAVDSSAAHNQARLPAQLGDSFCFSVVEGADHFTQMFDVEEFDLENTSIEFIPDGSERFYAVCSHAITQLPTDPAGGALIPLGDDNYAAIDLIGSSMVSLYGDARNVFFVGSNGYITFDEGDTDLDPSLADHFSRKRISAMFADLVPSDNVTFLELSDRVAVTYQNVREYGTTNDDTFQIELFYDGRITLSYLTTQTPHCLVGLSHGEGLPNGFIESDLSSYPCRPTLTVVTPDGGEFYEPGDIAHVQWTAVGTGWQIGDTVAIEASSDGGSTWSQIPGAGALPYDLHQVDWNTAGWPASTRYRLRIVANDDPTVNDASNGDFSIAVDSTPPVVTHAQYPDTGDTGGPYSIGAQVTDNLGVASVVMYWSKNGGPFNAVTMTPSGANNEYWAEIPGPSVSCTDSYCYHFVATDASAAANSVRNPSSGEYCFSIAGPSIQVPGASLMFELPPGGTGSQTMTIANSGCTPLEWRIMERAASGVIYESVPNSSAAEHRSIDWSEPYAPGRLIVGIKPGTQAAQRMSIHAQAGAKVESSFRIVSADVVKVDAGVDIKAVAVKYSTMPGVTYVEPDYMVSAFNTPDDPMFADQWALHNTGQNGGVVDADIDAPEAWDAGTGGHEFVVAVVDTGICYTHPDLAANMWVNPGEIPDNGLDDDGNGYIDDVHGYDFANNDGSPMDDDEHGTHVAGIIGAVANNGLGISGVNWNVRLMALKFLGSDGQGQTSNAVKCIEYAIAMGANIISNSWGSGSYSQTLDTAISAAGAAGQLVIAAAGNEGVNTDTSPIYPACLSQPNIISVAATDRNDSLAQWATGGGSNWGLNTVDLAAPGKDILSTIPVSGYTAMEGTSMATPFVAGACALLMSVNPDATKEQIKHWILGGVDQKPSLAGKMVSGGRLNINNAVLLSGISWLDETPKSGTVPPGESRSITVTADATGLNDGFIETGSIAIRSNDYAQPALVVPVTLNVVQTGRYLRLDAPNGGEWCEPGGAVNITWTPLGTDWQTTDPVKLEASADGGITWTQIPGADNVRCLDGAYTWQTAGWAPSSKYRVRVVFLANEGINDSSDADFAIAIDTTPPVITHTPLVDSGNLPGPYTVYAGITDNYAVGTVTLHWRRNDSAFSSVSMTPTGTGDQYSGQIPGPSTDGDRYCYYIEAADASAAHNAALEPAGAPTALHCFMVRSVVTLPVSLTDAEGYKWDIQPNGSISDGSSDAFDGGFVLSSFPNAASGGLEEAGREIVINDGVLTGVRVTRKVYVPSNRAYCRFLEIVRNLGDTPATHTVRLDTNLGSDNSTVVVGTSDGDTAFEPTDQWIVTDDAEGTGDPVVTHVIGGPGGAQLPSQVSYTAGFIGYTYSLTLAPGETKTIMHFGAQGLVRADAVTKAGQIAGLAPVQDCLAGMSSFERSKVVNFAIVGRTVSLISPNGGEWYEPGTNLAVQWVAAGADWQTTDTVRLEASPNDGGTWTAIPGAGSLAYNAGSFVWNTTGVTPSDGYRLRVVMNGDAAVTDTSDNIFVIAPDDIPPAIDHTPLGDTNDLTGPYPVCAQITENLGLASVTLYWSRNGGAFTPVAMSPSGSAGTYCASIPGPSSGGDRYCYYISATDSSSSAHTVTAPGAAPAEVYCFTVRHVVGLPVTLYDGDNRMWDIQQNGSILTGSNDAFDGVFVLSGFPSATAGTAEDGDREIAISDGASTGVQVTRKVYVPADRAYARFSEIVTNNSDSPAQYTVRIDSNLGSDTETVVVGTSDGDTVFEPTDQWIVTDDADGTGDPPIMHVIAGVGAAHTPDAVRLSGDTLGFDYVLDLAPHETKTVVSFGAQCQSRAAATTKASQLASLNSAQNCLFGMTSQERSQVVNFFATGMMLTVIAPNGGETYVRGDTVPVRWNAAGPDWKAGDTVRVEVSTDDGATWTPVPGAASLAFDAGLFNWNTTGAVGSSTYRVSVVRNGATSISDASDAPFSIVASESTRDCKLNSDTSLVALSGKRVSAVFGDCFYIQEEDRSSGIGVRWAVTKPAVGDLATVTGRMITVDGERMIEAITLSWVDPDGIVPIPMGINGRSIGGGDLGYSSGPPPVGQKGILGKIGLNNIGLLVKAWGMVTGIDQSPTPQFFNMYDGNGIVQVDLISGAAVPLEGDWVSVIGVSSCLPDGDYLRPRIRLRSASELVNLSNP